MLLLFLCSIWCSRKHNPLVYFGFLGLVQFLCLAEGFSKKHLSSLDAIFKIYFLQSKYRLLLPLQVVKVCLTVRILIQIDN